MTIQQAFEMRIPNEVMTSWKEVWAASDQVPLFIRFSADGSTCLVRGSAIACADLVDHLEQSLNLPKTTLIGLTAEPGQTTSARSDLAEALKRSGYSQAAVMDVRSVAEPDAGIEEFR